MAGSGTPEDPYLVQSIEDLVYLSNQVKAGTTYKGQTIKLTTNLNFKAENSYVNYRTKEYKDINGNGTEEELKTELTTGAGFQPIGISSDNPFEGNFEGNNKIISNLYIDNDTLTRIGLLGYINGSKIQNLTVTGNMHTTISAVCGGICGFSLGNSVISNIKNYVNIKSETGSDSVGGIIGNINGTVEIINCVNKGNMENSNNTGGIIGYNNGNLKIENCYNVGKITNTKGLHVGGLLGRDNADTNTTTIINSYNTGSVITNRDTEANAICGGIVGMIYGTVDIENCYNTGEVKNNRTSYTQSIEVEIGGIIGSLECKANTSNKIINSYNTGNITNGSHLGGIMGTNENENTLIIDKCYNTGKIESNKPKREIACGGLTGTLTTLSETYILNSYNTGDIMSSSSTGYGYAGGISGYLNQKSKGAIINCYNTGNVSNSLTPACGIIYVVDNGSTGATVINVNNVYNTGTLTANTTIYGILSVSKTSTASKVQNVYCDSRYTATSQTNVGTTMTLDNMKKADFVTTLNNNIKSIVLSDVNTVLKDYKLLTWKQVSNGYPTLDK